ncbi:MAG TPA: PGPGW domain-containing protein [Acidimicrobiia bacterium]|nr:PGPGW domain-containing protein [Acidimicrobiia bacterium]
MAVGARVRAILRFMVRGTRRAAITVIGFLLVALGIAGLLLPVLPGWVFIIAGFAVLSREYSWAQSALAYARRKAAEGGEGIRVLTRRMRRRPAEVFLPADDVVIDLTTSPALATVDLDLEDSEQTA